METATQNAESKVRRAATTKISGGADYAKVAERVRLFREDCPRGLIETEPVFLEGGALMFKARILKDKADPNSAESKAHAHSGEKPLGKEKAFEKLESIAVGRALANLGYLASGEIASSEEMEEYEQFLSEKKLEEVEKYKSQISSVKSIQELASAWSALPIDMKQELRGVKDEMKQKLDSQKPQPAKEETRKQNVEEPTIEEIENSLPSDLGGPDAQSVHEATSKLQ